MAELLVRIVSKPDHPTDKRLSAGRTNRGDVIVVKPDGWPWSEREKSNPAWRIIPIPGVLTTVFASMLEPGDDLVERFPRKRVRRYALDDNVAVKAALGRQRKGDGIDAVLSVEALDALKRDVPTGPRR